MNFKHMPFQIPIGNKSFAAVFIQTNKFPFSYVNSFMNLQIAFFAKSFMTQIAFEWFFVQLKY